MHNYYYYSETSIFMKVRCQLWWIVDIVLSWGLLSIKHSMSIIKDKQRQDLHTDNISPGLPSLLPGADVRWR